LSHADLQTEILSFKMAAVSLWKLTVTMETEVPK